MDRRARPTNGGGGAAVRPVGGKSSGGNSLKGHIPISGTTIHGRSAIIFGMLFVGMGIFIVLMVTGVIPSRSAPRPRNIWPAGLAGGVFALAGMWVIIHGLSGVIAQRRARRMRVKYPDEPWRSDYAWDDRGVTDMQGRGVRQMLFGMMFMIAFAAPFNLVMYHGVKEGSKAGFIFGCVNLFVAFYVAAFVYRLARWFKYGAGRIAFRRFPFHLGDRAELAYVPARRLKGVTRLSCTLRCIRESFVTTQVQGKTRTEIVSSVLHHETLELSGDALNASHDRSVPLSFHLPADAEPTRLLDRPPVYWQLQISAETPGIDLDSRFLVPIYARPGPAREPIRSRDKALQEVAGIISMDAAGRR